MYALHLAYPQLLYVFIPLLAILTLYRYRWHHMPRYRFSLTSIVSKKGLAKKPYHHYVFFLLRLFTLSFLVFLITRPQWIDKNSKIHGQGRDIVLAIDVSGSMQVFDDVQDRRSRIQVAKEEAIHFIDKRIDDPIGLVIFAKDSLSRSPITLDKLMLKQAVYELKLGFIDPDGTSLGTGLATAVNRLRKSKSKSKIIILLTDGEPTPHTDRIAPDVAIEMAKQFGIKVYTVGIGNEQGGFVMHPFGGLQRLPMRIDTKLLKEIAQKTGGRFFRANNPADMRQIYRTIDTLETSEYNTNIFQRYYEALFPFLWFILLLFGLEVFLKLFIWRGL